MKPHVRRGKKAKQARKERAEVRGKASAGSKRIAQTAEDDANATPRLPDG